jgi:hypothetical protein
MGVSKRYYLRGGIIMAIARKRLIDPSVTRWYHCISRCCRRLPLLGSGMTDRKAWLQNRIQELTDVFAISVAGFSVLDNHLHLLIRLDPERALDWSEEEVARRWAKLFPPRLKRKIQPVSPQWIESKVADPQWIAKRREHLQSASWFMKLLKEPLARMANREEGCEGAFFSPRFKSIALLDLRSLLSACIYIDLNPMAAGINYLFEQSPYTSVAERLRHCWPSLTQNDWEAALAGHTVAHLPSGEAEQSHWLCPLEDRRRQGASREGMLEGLSLPKYLLMLDAMARVPRKGKARLDAQAAPILERLGISEDDWHNWLAQITKKLSRPKIFGRVLASSRQLLQQTARRWGLHHVVNVGGKVAMAKSVDSSSLAPDG